MALQQTEVISKERVALFLDRLQFLADGLRASEAIYCREHFVVDPDKDGRHRTFGLLGSVIETTQLGLIFVTDCLLMPDWWEARIKHEDGTAITKENAQKRAKEYVQFLKISLSNGIYVAIERSFRLFLRTLNQKDCDNGNGTFSCIYRQLFKSLKMSRWETTLEIAGNLRNTLHNNGVFFPRDHQKRTYTFLDYEIEFEPGQPIEFPSWMFLLDLISELLTMCVETLNHPKIAKLPRLYDPLA